MSVVGFDVGNDTSCVALARKGGIDVLLNKESVRETPAVVNFGEKMRFLGVDGAAKQGLQPANTINQLKRLLGKKFKDPKVQADIAKLPFKVSEAPNGGCQITCMYQNESVDFTPEQLMAMVMVDLKKIAERETGHPPVDCVLSVPVYYTEAQRYAMLNAASIAGLNCLRLMNETTATALAYGIFKTDLPETDPVHVAFVDVGHSSTQVRNAQDARAGTRTHPRSREGGFTGGKSRAGSQQHKAPARLQKPPAAQQTACACPPRHSSAPGSAYTPARCPQGCTEKVVTSRPRTLLSRDLCWPPCVPRRSPSWPSRSTVCRCCATCGTQTWVAATWTSCCSTTSQQSSNRQPRSTSHPTRRRRSSCAQLLARCAHSWQDRASHTSSCQHSPERPCSVQFSWPKPTECSEGQSSRCEVSC